MDGLGGRLRITRISAHEREADVLIVGAGPAGLMAAIAAARSGARVAVCEQLERPGAKLQASGGGRCNLTNTLSAIELAGRFGRQGHFTLPALQTMDGEKLREFFGKRGVPTSSSDGFHVFPCSNRAADVLDALLVECTRLQVRLHYGTKVTGLLIAEGKVLGASTTRGDTKARCVILASGGKSYPGLGGTGGGYALAREAGHTLAEPVPALVPLLTRERWPAACTAVVIPDVRLRINVPGLRDGRTEGDVLFTHSGISGPAVLDLSGAVARLLLTHETVPLSLDFFPEKAAADWQRCFDLWQRDEGRKHVATLLGRDLPFCVADSLCAQAGGIGAVPAAQFSRAARQSLAWLLTAAPLTVTSTAGFDKAMVTSGGVILKQVNPRTLESRLVEALYFAGEVLDLDGPCGGYNLQWAFSSGWLAGLSCGAQEAG